MAFVQNFHRKNDVTLLLKIQFNYIIIILCDLIQTLSHTHLDTQNVKTSHFHMIL